MNTYKHIGKIYFEFSYMDKEGFSFLVSSDGIHPEHFEKLFKTVASGMTILLIDISGSIVSYVVESNQICNPLEGLFKNYSYLDHNVRATSC